MRWATSVTCLAWIDLHFRAALHYTAAHSMSQRDAAMILEVLLAAIRATRDAVAPSPEEDTVVVLVDFYRLQKYELVSFS